MGPPAANGKRWWCVRDRFAFAADAAVKTDAAVAKRREKLFMESPCYRKFFVRHGFPRRLTAMPKK